MNTTSPFSTDFLQRISEQLKKEKSDIERELANITTKHSGKIPDVDEAFPDYGEEEDDNAREIAEYTANKQLQVTLENTLRDIDKATKRLEEGTYGICKYCDQPIDEKRLLARPTSSSCVSCKKTLTDEL